MSSDEQTLDPQADVDTAVPSKKRKTKHLLQAAQEVRVSNNTFCDSGK